MLRCIAMSEISAFQGIALLFLYMLVHFIGNIETIHIQQMVQCSQMRPIHRAHIKFNLQKRTVKTHIRHIRHILLVHLKLFLVIFHFDIIRIIQILCETQAAQHKLLCKVNVDRYVWLLEVGRIDDPCTMYGHIELVGKVGRVYDATLFSECAAT